MTVLAVHASPTCERVVHRYVTVPVRNKVSKATLAAWAQWRKNHPEWKPNPKVKRPKYKMTQEEITDKVDFACEVPTDPTPIDLFFKPADFDVPPPPVVDVPPVEMSQLTMPDLLPPVLTDQPPQNPYTPPTYFAPSIIPPVGGGGGTPTPPVSPVPEPAGVALLGTAGAAAWLLRLRSRLLGHGRAAGLTLPPSEGQA